MNFSKIKSFAKVNLALNIISKSSKLHNIESLVTFINLYDLILIKQIKSKKNRISFTGKFSKNINSNNTVSKLFKILDEKKLIRKKFHIRIIKNIPQKAGLGGGSMNAANILNYLIKKRLIRINKKEILEIASFAGSDVILGLETCNSILTSKNLIKRFRNCKKMYTLVIKPRFGCSTKEIFSKVNKFDKIRFNRPSKRMFDTDFLKESQNSLEKIVINKHSILKRIRSYLSNLEKPIFVRMTGSGSAFIAYYHSKKQCDIAKKQFCRDYKKYWCISSKTI